MVIWWHSYWKLGRSENNVRIRSLRYIRERLNNTVVMGGNQKWNVEVKGGGKVARVSKKAVERGGHIAGVMGTFRTSETSDKPKQQEKG